jgi:hypothetical protein
MCSYPDALGTSKDPDAVVTIDPTLSFFQVGFVVLALDIPTFNMLLYCNSINNKVE